MKGLTGNLIDARTAHDLAEQSTCLEFVFDEIYEKAMMGFTACQVPYSLKKWEIDKLDALGYTVSCLQGVYTIGW